MIEAGENIKYTSVVCLMENIVNRFAKKWIHNLAIYEPGRPLEELARELGVDDMSDMHKLASNENSLGPSPKAVESMKHAAASMNIYPDGGAFYLRRALARKLDVDADQIVLGNGSNELIVFLSHVFLNADRNIVMSDKAFVIYKMAAAMFEADTIVVPMRDYHHDLDAMVAAVTPDTRLLYVSNPNNPTGTMVDNEAIERMMHQIPDHVTVVFDEAYIELLPPECQPDTLRYVREGRNVFVLRTFSKSYGLAGLRVGYTISTKKDAKLLQHVRQPFNVNAMAQVGALAALEDDEHLEKTRATVQAGLRQLERGLREMKIEFVESVANFMLVNVGRGRETFEALQRLKIIVRPMDGYGMPEMIRVTIGTELQNRCFLDALKLLLNERTVNT